MITFDDAGKLIIYIYIYIYGAKILSLQWVRISSDNKNVGDQLDVNFYQYNILLILPDFIIN